MTDDLARPVPPEEPPLPATGEDDGGRDENAGDGLPPRRRSRRRAVLIALGVLAVLVAVLLWIIKATDTGPDGSSSSPRSELARSAALLRDAPALHYTGTIKVKEHGNARLDLVVSNPGDALGTLTMPGSPPLEYVAIDGKSFLRGNTKAWQSLGMAEKSAVLAEHPSLVVPGVFFSQDLATTLAPPELAKTLLLKKVPDEKITVGDPVTVGDHSCTPFHADGMTICLGKEMVGGARFVDRIGFPGGSAVIDIQAMSRKEVNQFSADFPSKFTMAREAVNPRISVTLQTLRDYEGKCAPTLCIFKARVTVTFLGSTADAEASEAVQVNYAWTIDRDGAPVHVGKDCSGAVLIKPGKSTDLSCTATGPSVPVGGPSSGQYHSQIHTSDVALTEAEYKRLVRLAADHSKKVAALPDLPPPA
ncbi:hypothetical protein GCM10010345_86370 [Streptomyces canarius]|uniref:Uncharacterized protein n=1 Tax=Streptomyces canarius TaxID=285453 RepID=A0ABQ3DCQ6_9ACTN|nr:hypothetical protein GCM10010345_86370 [Streptomyces canarius]